MSRSVRIVGAALIPAFALPLGTATVARAAVPDPPTNKNLPSGLDIASPYVAQSICDPAAKPGVTAFARLMANHYEEYEDENHFRFGRLVPSAEILICAGIVLFFFGSFAAFIALLAMTR